jgi:TetR/AcrR family transcriptional repressor of nem operon
MDNPTFGSGHRRACGCAHIVVDGTGVGHQFLWDGDCRTRARWFPCGLENKDDIGQAVVKAWGEFGQSVYAEAWRQPGEPLEEIHRLFDIMEGLTRRPEPCVCLVGMLTQELSSEHPGFRVACARELETWTEMFRSRLEAAKQQLQPAVNFDPAEVAWFLNSLWQGSALVGKARQSTEMIRANLRLARDYVDALFANPHKPVSQ